MLSVLIWWIIVGLIAGWAAGKIMKGGGYGPLTDTILGMVVAVGGQMMKGALLGEWELPKDIPVLGRIPEIDLSDELKKEEKDSGTGLKSRRLRPVVLSSMLLSLLGVVAAGVYLWWKRF